MTPKRLTYAAELLEELQLGGALCTINKLGYLSVDLNGIDDPEFTHERADELAHIILHYRAELTLLLKGCPARVQ